MSHCNINYCKKISKFGIEHSTCWLYLEPDKVEVLSMGKGLYFNPAEECIIDTKEINHNGQKLTRLYNGEDLMDMMKDLPINWQYYYDKDVMKWRLADYHLTHQEDADIFADALAQTLIYLVENKFYEKILKWKPEEKIKLPKRCKGKPSEDK